MTTAPTPSAARSARAEASGSSRQQDDGLGARRCSTGRRPRSRTRTRDGCGRSGGRGRRAGARWSRRGWPGRGAGPCRARRRARGRAPEGSTSASRRTRPSAFETTLCAITRTSLRPRARTAVAQQRGQVVAGPDLRDARERVEPHAACTSRSSSARVRGAAPRPAASAARSAARSPGVSTSSSSDGSRADPDGRAAPRGRARRGGRTSRGRTRARAPSADRAGARWCPSRGGRARSRHAGAAEAEQLVDLGRVERGAVAGHEQDPLRPARHRRPHAAQRRRGLAGLDADRAPTRCRSGRLAGSRRAHRRRSPSSPRTAPSASSTSPTIAAASSARSTPGGPQPLLRAPEGLDGEDGDGTHGARRLPAQRGREHERLERDPAAGVGVAHLHVGLERRHAARPLVADQAVDQALVVGDDPVRVAADARPTA